MHYIYLKKARLDSMQSHLLCRTCQYQLYWGDPGRGSAISCKKSSQVAGLIYIVCISIVHAYWVCYKRHWKPDTTHTGTDCAKKYAWVGNFTDVYSQKLRICSNLVSFPVVLGNAEMPGYTPPSGTVGQPSSTSMHCSGNMSSVPSLYFIFTCLLCYYN